MVAMHSVEHELDCKMGHATLSNEYQTREEKFQVRTKMLERRADELKEQKREIEVRSFVGLSPMQGGAAGSGDGREGPFPPFCVPIPSLLACCRRPTRSRTCGR